MCVHECELPPFPPPPLPAGRYSSGADRKFALLEDVFRKFPEMPVSVEIKENNKQLIEKVQYTKNNCIYSLISLKPPPTIKL